MLACLASFVAAVLVELFLFLAIAFLLEFLCFEGEWVFVNIVFPERGVDLGACAVIVDSFVLHFVGFHLGTCLNEKVTLVLGKEKEKYLF